MGKQRGRAKAKERQELGASEARELLQRLDADGKLPTDAVLRLLACDQPRCEPPCKAPRKDNPGCICGLAPALGSFRVKGLWRKQPTVLSTLGSDPKQQRRKSPGHPCGLNNLGNTCYVNSALQFLHAIPSFCHALYTLEPAIAQQDIVKQLRDLFIQLEFGPRGSVDPTPFTKSLQLDHSIQQDGQEFMKLLLAKVEDVFRHSQQQEVREMVQQLFKGAYSYVTTCQACQRPSDSSSRLSDYYELSLPVVGFPTMEQSMLSLLSAEEMAGDNQYFCDFCHGKRDAQRQMSLRTAPPYLCLSLQRFVFDMKTYDKRKATDKLAFPLRFNLQQTLAHASLASGMEEAAAQAAAAACVGPDGSPAGEYELVAVMIHKGSSASQGHYVAHIKSPSTASWWRFDDETAEEMGAAPTTHPGDHGTTAAGQAGGASTDKKSTENRASVTGTKRAGAAGSKRRAAAGKGRGRGRGRGKARRVEEGSDEEDANNADNEAGASDDDVVVLDGDEPEAAGGSSANGGASSSKGANAPALSEISSANAYMLVYKLASWTDTTTLASTANGCEPTSHDPAAATQHTAAASEQDPDISPAEAEADATPQPADTSTAAEAAEAASRSARLQALPAAVRERVAEVEAEFAAACEAHEAMKAQALQQVEARQQEVRQILETAATEDPGDDGRFISTAWLQDWAGDSEAAPGPIDNGVLLCVHGGLDPAKLHFMKRISSLAWEQLQSMHSGGPALGPSDACVECLRQCLEAIVSSDDAQDKRAAVLATLQAMEAVEGEEGGGEVLLGPGAHYVSKTWLQGWTRRQGTMSTASPTANITCQHGRLAPDVTTAAKRTAVSGEVWQDLHDLWLAGRRQAAIRTAQKAARQAVQQREGQQEQQQQQQQQEGQKHGGGMSSDDGLEIIGEVVGNGAATAAATATAAAVQLPPSPTANGHAAPSADFECVAFPVSEAWPCPECSAQLQQVTQGVADAKAGLEAEKEALPTLAANVVEVLEAGETYYLVPNDWIKQWRQHLGQASRRTKDIAAAGAVEPPPPLHHAILPLLCSCHPDSPRLAVLPPDVLNKRGRFSQSDHAKDPLRVISATEWHTLSSFHSGTDTPAPDHGPSGGPPTEGQLAAARAGVQALLQIEAAASTAAGAASTAAGAAAAPAAAANGMKAAGPGAVPDAGVDAAGSSGRDGGAGAGARGDGAAVDGIKRGSSEPIDIDGDVIMLDAPEPSAAADGPPTRHSRRRRGVEPEPQSPNGIVDIISDGGGDEASECSDPELAYLRKAHARRRNTHRTAGPSTAHGSNSSRSGRGGGGGGGGGSYGSGMRGSLVTVPGVCEEHMAREARAAREAALVYVDAEVMVEVVRSEEELQAALQPSGAERKSKRARKGRAPIKVSSTATLGDLKLRMLEALDVHPRNVVLYVRGQPAGCDELTLAQAEIFPHEEIRALITGDHPDDDYASLFDTSGTGKRREVEMGFKNTALTGTGAGTAAAAAEGGGGVHGQGANGDNSHKEAAGGDDAVADARADAPANAVDCPADAAPDVTKMEEEGGEGAGHLEEVQVEAPSHSKRQRRSQGEADGVKGESTDVDMGDADGQRGAEGASPSY